MSKTKTQYACNECGGLAPKWIGQCLDCGAWNSMTEVVLKSPKARWQGYAGEENSAVVSLPDIPTTSTARLSTGISELDQVLGGGMVEGSAILIGGDPGIGKSTLLLQALAQLKEPEAALYVTGEESLSQVSLRAQRLGLGKVPLNLLAETQIENIMAIASKQKPKVMVIDSVQTINTQLLQSAPGSVSQVRESAAQLIRFAKQSGITIYLVGHVNKDGELAGPRVLEHMVDTVLYFEGEKDNRFRMLRAIKNRFGAVNELGIFGMTDKGLKGVSNPSAIFLTNMEPQQGTCVTVSWEGSRPLLIEIQALVDDAQGVPRRVAVGYDHNRLALLLAVMHRYGGISMHQMDVFLNVVGGVKITETGADLAIIAAVISSFQNKIMANRIACFGEIGLNGELRPVTGGQDRILEAIKHGFKTLIVPKGNKMRQPIQDVEVHAVATLKEALDKMF